MLSQRNHTIEWALSQSPKQLTDILAGVRRYCQSLPKTLKLRGIRDEQLIRERSERLATEHAKKNAARTKRKEALSHVQLLKSITQLQLALTQHPGKTARLAFLKEQLSVYKHPPYSEKTGIRFSVKGVARTSNDLQQLTESLIRKHFPDTANSSTSGVTVPSSSVAVVPTKRRRN